MSKMVVVKTGGKQYLVKAGDEIVVDKLDAEKDKKLDLETLAVIDNDAIELGSPTLTKKTSVQVMEQAKGEKLRVSRFKSKVRYRKTKGFRPSLTRIKIISL